MDGAVSIVGRCTISKFITPSRVAHLVTTQKKISLRSAISVTDEHIYDNLTILKSGEVSEMDRICSRGDYDWNLLQSASREQRRKDFCCRHYRDFTSTGDEQSAVRRLRAVLCGSHL